MAKPSAKGDEPQHWHWQRPQWHLVPDLPPQTYFPGLSPKDAAHIKDQRAPSGRAGEAFPGASLSPSWPVYASEFHRVFLPKNIHEKPFLVNYLIWLHLEEQDQNNYHKRAGIPGPTSETALPNV